VIRRRRRGSRHLAVAGRLGPNFAEPLDVWISRLPRRWRRRSPRCSVIDFEAIVIRPAHSRRRGAAALVAQTRAQRARIDVQGLTDTVVVERFDRA